MEENLLDLLTNLSWIESNDEQVGEINVNVQTSYTTLRRAFAVDEVSKAFGKAKLKVKYQ